MADREYVCGYKNCLHHGEKVKSSEAVVISGKRYHWDCAAIKQTMKDIKDTYAEKIDNKVDFRVLGKILNDLIFKYELDVEYVKFAVEFYAKSQIILKSPFTLLYLRDNECMRKKWERSKGR